MAIEYSPLKIFFKDKTRNILTKTFKRKQDSYFEINKMYIPLPVCMEWEVNQWEDEPNLIAHSMNIFNSILRMMKHSFQKSSLQYLPKKIK